MSDLTLIATVSTFPSGASYTVQQFADAFAQRLTLALPSSGVLFGQIGGIEPTSALPGNGSTPGLYWDGTAWRSWSTDSGKYLPISPIAGNFSNNNLYEATFLCTNIAGNTTITIPADVSGTMALLSDVQVIAGTQTLTGTVPSLDWSKKQPAYIVLTGNTTIGHVNQGDGQIQDLFAENNGTSYTLTIGGTTWPGNTAPTMTTSSAGTRKIDRYRFINVGGVTTGAITFGQVIANSTGSYAGSSAAYSIGSGSDTVPPAVSSIAAANKQPFIDITFNKVLQGATLSTSDFIVLKGAVNQVIVAAAASGTGVVVQVGANLNTTASWSIQYVGSDIKDLSGNLASGFGPTTISVTNSSGQQASGGGQ